MEFLLLLRNGKVWRCQATCTPGSLGGAESQPPSPPLLSPLGAAHSCPYTPSALPVMLTGALHARPSTGSLALPTGGLRQLYLPPAPTLFSPRCFSPATPSTWSASCLVTPGFGSAKFLLRLSLHTSSRTRCLPQALLGSPSTPFWARGACFLSL